MADGLAVGVVDSVLDLIFSGTTYAGNASVYAQLHVGAPGSAGTANPAGETLRVITGTLTAASAGAKSNEAAINWTSVSTAETYSHVSLWSAITAGTFLGSGAITASAVAVGDNFQIPIGDLTITQPVAS
jgi:hypothetical protein